jgi:hypothetical protein
MSASTKAMTSPRARTTPARTAAPFPLFRAKETTEYWGQDARCRCATSAVPSVLPSSTTRISVSSGGSPSSNWESPAEADPPRCRQV